MTCPARYSHAAVIEETTHVVRLMVSRTDIRPCASFSTCDSSPGSAVLPASIRVSIWSIASTAASSKAMIREMFSTIS